MSEILYYSNYCDKCIQLLQLLNKSEVKKNINFLCIDQRIKNSNGTQDILLKNGSRIQLPDIITRVPALLLPNKGYQVLFGEQIYQHLQPQEITNMNTATQNQGEPDCYSFSNSGFSSVLSDKYSFLDMNSDDLSAKGNGGTRQMYNYSDILHNNTTIQTPPDTYTPDKINESDVEQYQKTRN